jgi:hypothetical protein
MRNLQGDFRVKQLLGTPIGRPPTTFREFTIIRGGPRWRKEAHRVGNDAYSYVDTSFFFSGYMRMRQLLNVCNVSIVDGNGSGDRSEFNINLSYKVVYEVH